MVRLVGVVSVLLGGLSLLGLSLLVPTRSIGIASATAIDQTAESDSLQARPAPFVSAEPVVPPHPTPLSASKSGVLLVVSLPSQKLFVFRDGILWDSSPVSTGRRGHETPVGAFTILQKKVRHRSTIYRGAPMPYMQRLTWDGVAFHAGYVPGHPASHGCIRLPTSFARRLYGLTNPATTAVLVSDRPMVTAVDAHSLASGEPAAPTLAERIVAYPDPPASVARDGRTQTIQLAAATNADSAARLWQRLLQRRPELQNLDHQIVAATVRSARVFRLRASGHDAHSICTTLIADGIACLKVRS